MTSPAEETVVVVEALRINARGVSLVIREAVAILDINAGLVLAKFPPKIVVVICRGSRITPTPQARLLQDLQASAGGISVQISVLV